MIFSENGDNFMKRTATLIATVALMLNLGVASVYAQQNVKMTSSGNVVPSTINLVPNTNTDDFNLAGKGSLGPFTYRELHADTASPQPSTTCSPGPYFRVVIGAGVFRFQDGSLMTVNITEGALCLDLTVPVGHLTVTYQITGGTGRFKSASGTLTLTAALRPVLFTASGHAAFLTDTGKFEGTVSGVADEEEREDE